jgi:hypothetical protein
METRHSNACLSTYGMKDESAFVLKRDASLSKYGMKDEAAFVLKVDATLVTHVSLYMYNQRRAKGMRVFLLS